MEKPVRVIQHKDRKHKTETRVFRRDIHESFCDQKGCEFYGKHAAQGVCHTRFGDAFPHAYFDAISKSAESTVAFYRKQYKGKRLKEYVKVLEGMAICAFMNERLGLDELIRHRIETARLRNRAGKYK